MNIKHLLFSIIDLIHFLRKLYYSQSYYHFHCDDARYTNNVEQFERKKTF